MTIYVDEITDYGDKKDAPPNKPFAWGKWSHLWTDGDDAELDDFAQRIGLRLSWSQESKGAVGRFYHYDVRPAKRDLAIQHGAHAVLFRDFVRERMKEKGLL